MNGPAHPSKARREAPEPGPRRHTRVDLLLTHPVGWTILRLAIPNSTVMLVQVLIGLLEVYFVARLGLDALAGVTLVFPLLALTVAISQGATGGGIVTSVARALGRGDAAEANAYPWYALVLAVPLGLATTTFMYVFGPPIYRAMGGHGAALAISLQYSGVVFGGATLIWTFNLLLAAVRGTGNLRVPVVVVCSGAAVLVPLSPLLIFGGFGVPALGPIGGGVALLVYYGGGSLAYAVYLWGHRGVLRPSRTPPRLALAPALTVLKIGGVSAIIAASTNVTLTLVTAYVGAHGIAALAGYGSASRLEFLLVPISYGIGGPVGMVVSASLGAGLIERARQAAWTGSAIGAAVTAAIGLVGALFAPQWIALFNDDPVAISAGVQYLHDVGPFFGFFGLGFVLYCVGQATRRLSASLVGALTRALIAAAGGYLLLRWHASLMLNFFAVSAGMMAFGLIPLWSLIRRVGFERPGEASPTVALLKSSSQ
ncbi:MATE family efflux transporter [Rhodopseudomonas palustris]|uniref:MATE family efflux transporter n=1 Tax=Rhodopseudomonas palustris TaxID=1076 RepID=UPI0015FF4EDD|nr:MATE family efflux transporter [Rhodopseudomonas palustris]